MVLESFLFDLDGTVWDSQQCVVDSLADTFREAGIETGPSEILRGLHSHNSPIGLLKSKRLSQASFWPAYRRNLSKVRLFFDSTSWVFANMKARGRKVAFVTSLRKEFVIALMSRFELDKFADVVVTPSECRIPKPSPSSINIALRQLGTAPRNAIYTGNQGTDIVAAKRANCWSALAKWGATGVIGPKADYEFQTLKQILTLVN